MSAISAISSSSIASMYQLSATQSNYSLTDDEKSTLEEILSKYDAEDMTEEDMQSMMDEIKDAGIRPGEDLKDALEEAGFEMKPPSGPPPPPPPQTEDTESTSTETPQYLLDFLQKYEAGEVTDEDLASLAASIKSQSGDYTGLLVDATT
jgi:hypothetical protein